MLCEGMDVVVGRGGRGRRKLNYHSDVEGGKFVFLSNRNDDKEAIGRGGWHASSGPADTFCVGFMHSVWEWEGWVTEMQV